MMKKIIILLLVSLIVSGCFMSNKTPDMQASIQAVDFLNPNINNQSSPVVVTFYQLKSPTKFQQTTFFNLYNDPAKTLGSDLVEKYELEIRPQQKEEFKQFITLGVTHIGIVAAFRNPDKTQWRRLVAVTPGKKVKLVVSLQSQSINVTAN